MGSPKPLLEFQGETFLDRLIGIFGPLVEEVIVVLGHEADAIRSAARRADQAIFVRNPAPERGQLSSLQCGLRAVRQTIDGIVFTPVDHAAVRPSTVARLLAEFERSGLAVAAPRFDAKNGHPVLIRPRVAERLLELPESSAAREVIHAYAGETLYLDVDDPAVIAEINDPESYRRLCASARGE